MQPAKVAHFRERLLSMRARLSGELHNLIETVPEKAGFPGNLSNLPMHLADTNAEGLDGELLLIHNEGQMLEQVDAALERIDNGSFAICQDCEGPVAEARLDAIPYAAYCIRCAHRHEQQEAEES